MRLFFQRILAGRKIIVIFLVAIFLPTIIIGYFSFNTFAKRRESVKRLLESNLWISGQAALQSVENRLLEFEKQALRNENFSRLIDQTVMTQKSTGSAVLSIETLGRHFILDENFRIAFPKTVSPESPFISFEQGPTDSQFEKSFGNAEYLEFSHRNYMKAAEEYQKSLEAAVSKQNQAVALEGLGRSLLFSRRYQRAREAYNKLSRDYAQLRNKAGHPYGLVAALQLYEIDQEQKKEEDGLRTLLDVYEKLRNGVWLLDSPTYDFFISEIESNFDSKFDDGKFPEIQKSCQALKAEPSPHLRELEFLEFLKNEAVPKVRERRTIYRDNEIIPPGRFFASSEENIHLISYCLLSQLETDRTFYGGFSWDLDIVKTQLLPDIMTAVSEDSGLQLRVLDDKNPAVVSGLETESSNESLILSFLNIPLPWKLIAAQPAFMDLQKTAWRENFFYGILLIFIVVLMFLGVLLIVRDISRESETTQMKTEFVHNVSHELKTPLTLIRLYGETLQRKENLSGEDRQEAYEIITKESERLSHMINNILDFSRIEMGRKEFEFKKGSFAAVIRETLESYRYHLEKKGFLIKEEITPDLPEIVFDKEAMASVLINLLSNAMKFSPEKKEVEVKLFQENNHIVLQVSDKGIGIYPKDKSRIFERFYRFKNRMVSESKGSGLGLALVKHVVEAHGGRIRVESEPGKGSVFSVYIPVSISSRDEGK